MLFVSDVSVHLEARRTERHGGSRVNQVVIYRPVTCLECEIRARSQLHHVLMYLLNIYTGTKLYFLDSCGILVK